MTILWLNSNRLSHTVRLSFNLKNGEISEDINFFCGTLSYNIVEFGCTLHLAHELFCTLPISEGLQARTSA